MTKPIQQQTLHWKVALVFLVVFVSYSSPSSAYAIVSNNPPLPLSSQWTVTIEEKNGLPVISNNGMLALSSSFVFWGNNWQWASLTTDFKIKSPFHYALTGKNKALSFDLAGEIQKESKNRLIWELDLNAQTTSKDVIGGGIVFKFNPATFSPEFGKPELLPNNRGWTWGTDKDNRIEMQFEPALASVYFEQGNKAELRAFFYQGIVPQGRQHYTATLTIPNHFSITPIPSERFGTDDATLWSQDILDWNDSPVDLSFLNKPEKPAGWRGFVQARGDGLVFEDGTPIQFWGTNITAYTLFMTPKDQIRVQAKRLSSLGFNLVRLHHHDSIWVNPNIFGNAKNSNTQHLERESLDKIDWWIKCLKDEGIYVWLDLHVGRTLKIDDHISNFDEISKGKPQVDLKGYNYINSSIKQAMKRFNEDYVTHINSYTGLSYKNEPAIATMLITNENDITNHFGNALLPDKKVPAHNKIYMQKAEEFAKHNRLSKDKTWRSWEHGPSKIFLNDLEQEFNREMINHLRALGVRVPIATTNTWGGNPLSSLPALTSGDLIDVHSYGEIGELEKNPLITANMMHWMAAGQVVDKPISITEWNVSPFPTPDRHSIPLYIASSASHQGWDALMQYAYSQAPLNNSGSPSNWNAFNDPALMSTLPAAALLYRQKHVQEASTTYTLDLGHEQFFSQPVSPANSIALRTAAEKGKLLIALPKTKELAWLKPGAIPQDSIIITDPSQSLLEIDALEVFSDTGELKRNWDKGIFTINTPFTQAAMGWIGGESIILADINIRITTRNATVAVQSLDNLPINQSQKLLISLGARSTPAPGNKLPFFSEPVHGQITIQAPEGLQLYRKDKSQAKKKLLSIYWKGKYLFNLDENTETYWLFLEK